MLNETAASAESNIILFTFALQGNPTCVQGNFGLKLQNSLQLPHIHARLFCDANDTFVEC